ncbi:MAG: 3-dehydroquinate synthase family protein [Saprospiraceae bacterium]
MKTIRSTIGDIYFGQVNADLKQLVHDHTASSVFILADSHTAIHCVPQVVDVIGMNSRVIVIPHGEQNKNLDSCQTIWSEMIKAGADRESLLLNIGGGMICDLGGFAASCFQRGIRFAHIPTSVLAMTDAAIGGKTGIDFGGLKNYIGVMSSPSFIWIEKNFLKTLPQIEFISGSAEVVKHAVVANRNLFDLLTDKNSLYDLDWDDVLEESISVKLKIVEADFFEKGKRKILNFGHTAGHALESFFLKTANPLSHGQCVTLGMLIESRMANLMGLLNNQDFNVIVSLIDHLLSPVLIPMPTFAELKLALSRDKKTRSGLTGYSLPEAIGSCQWDIQVEDQVIIESFLWLSTHEQTDRERLIAG